MYNLFNEKEILKYFQSFALDGSEYNYIKIHAKRYYLLLSTIDNCISSFNSSKINILDIGPCFQTELIKYKFNKLKIDTQGKNIPKSMIVINKHYKLDLNIIRPNHNTNIKKYDIIIMSEVLEHFKKKPIFVF